MDFQLHRNYVNGQDSIALLSFPLLLCVLPRRMQGSLLLSSFALCAAAELNGYLSSEVSGKNGQFHVTLLMVEHFVSPKEQKGQTSSGKKNATDFWKLDRYDTLTTQGDGLLCIFSSANCNQFKWQNAHSVLLTVNRALPILD